MAKYTTELRNICDYYGRDVVESWFKSYKLEDYLTQKEIDTITSQGLWTKDKLAKKIVDAYYFREIGQETPEMFKHYAMITMERIMEKQLQIIYSASIEIDPLINVDYKETYDMAREGTDKSNGTGSSSGLSVNSDTPQGQINKTEILQGKYASATSAGESTSNSSGNSETTGKEKWTRTKKGNDGITATQQKLIGQYRNILIAIDDNIIKELNDLFMGIY